MMNQFKVSLGLIAGLLLIATTAVANPHEYPEWGTSFLNFKACTADGWSAEVQFKVSNFSPFDTDLPGEQYTWATKEEFTSAALEVFKNNIPPFIAQTTADQTEVEGYLGALSLTPTTIAGEQNGQVGEWEVTLGLKNTLQTKMLLMKSNKYSALSVNFEKANTWIKVDRQTSCDPSVNPN